MEEVSSTTITTSFGYFHIKEEESTTTKPVVEVEVEIETWQTKKIYTHAHLIGLGKRGD